MAPKSVNLALIAFLACLVHVDSTRSYQCPNDQVWGPDDPCSRFCTADVNPVCGAVDGVDCFKTYNNPCYLEIAQCVNPRIEEVPCKDKEPIKPDKCTDAQVTESFAPCDKPCPKIYKKVCGAVDGNDCFKTYDNDCRFEIAQCKNRAIQKVRCDKIRRGPVITKPAPTSGPFVPDLCNIGQEWYPSCDKPCTFEYNPVCGAVNGVPCSKPYPNACALKNAQCKNPRIKKVPCKGKEPIKPDKCTDDQVWGPDDRCSRFCTADVNPVCGAVDGVYCFKTYSNPCNLGIAICKNPRIKEVRCKRRVPITKPRPRLGVCYNEYATANAYADAYARSDD